MQDAVGLAGAFVDGDTGFDEVVADLQKLNAQRVNGGTDVNGGEMGEGDGLLPDAHKMNL